MSTEDPKMLAELAEEWYFVNNNTDVPERGTPEWDSMFEQYLDYAFGDEAAEFDTESMRRDFENGIYQEEDEKDRREMNP